MRANGAKWVAEPGSGKEGQDSKMGPSGPISSFCLIQFVDDLIHDPVFQGLVRIHPVVTLKILTDALNGLSGVVSQDACAHFLGTEDLLGMDLHIRAHTLNMSTQ